MALTFLSLKHKMQGDMAYFIYWYSHVMLIYIALSSSMVHKPVWPIRESQAVSAQIYKSDPTEETPILSSWKPV